MKLKTLIRAGKYVGIALTGLVVVSCKKDNPKPEPEPEPVVNERTETQSIKDDVYKYYKLYSLWETSIPDYTSDPSKFTDQYGSADDVLAALKRLTPAHAAYPGGVFDRFSYIQGVGGYSTGTRGANPLKMDTQNGFGLFFQLGTTDEKVARPIIYFVEGGSPAQVAGFRRSDMISKIGDDANFSVPVTCSGEGDNRRCQVSDQTALDNMMSRLNSALDGGSMKLEVLRQDGSVFTKSINYGKEYVINPIYKDTIFENAGNNIGYLALSSFEKIEANNDNQQNIDAVFKKFESGAKDNQKIRSLIVDLRYNGGGYVDAAVYIADKIAGTIPGKQLMLTYETNTYLKSSAAGSLRNDFLDTYFKGTSSLQLSKVYFLVSENTASASEMLINVLKPYLQVQVIGSSSRTYGKPVGFFLQDILYKRTLKAEYWPVSFMLRNAKGESEYWDGLVPNKANVPDDVFNDVGDKRESMLATALNDAAPGITTRASINRVSTKRYRMLDNGVINIRPDRGMIKKR